MDVPEPAEPFHLNIGQNRIDLAMTRVRKRWRGGFGHVALSAQVVSSL
jgi:hypothetical protein